MGDRGQRRPSWRLSLGLAMWAALTGCATSDELDRVSSSLQQRLDMMSNGLRSETGRLQSQLDALGKRQQEVARAIEGLKTAVESELRTTRSETKSVMEEYRTREASSGQMLKDLRAETVQTRRTLEETAVRTQQELARLDAFAEQANKEIRGLQHAITSLGNRLDAMPALVSGIGSELHGLNQTLLGSYRMEETALRERLKMVEQMVKRLKPAPAEVTSDGAKPAPSPASYGEGKGGTAQSEAPKPQVRLDTAPAAP